MATPTSEIVNVYNYGDIKTWFVTIASKEKYENKHMMEYEARRREGVTGERFSIFALNTAHTNKGIKGIIKWVPPGYQEQRTKDILKGLSKDGTEPHLRKVDEENTFKIFLSPKGQIEDVPHSIKHKKGGNEHLISLQLEGRRVMCCDCGTDRHMPKQCENIFAQIADSIKFRNGKCIVEKYCGKTTRGVKRGTLKEWVFCGFKGGMASTRNIRYKF